MGKKGKTGKQRRDKYYHLAKETGYRARSAFKLIQLNRKFGFLEKSRCLIDLCAAPGGWLQVAAQYMPMSSLIIGVDLVSIKPIPKVITLQEDITTERCRQALKKELHTWKVDCVLNDGAPNVGSAWVQDAFSQAQLTLSALKLASEFLKAGGTFVTKVFRSKDYQPLMWVFEQLFKKVNSTKPQASRNESAEIFVVCQGYIAPDKLDPKFLDPKYIFEEVQSETKKKTTMLQLEKPSKKAEGYAENDYTLFRTEKVSNFLQNDSPLDILASVNELVFDDEKYLKHELTTEEIKLCCKDIKVLGKAEIRSLLSWHKNLKKEFFGQEAQKESDEKEESEEDEEETIQKTIQSLQEEEEIELKRKKKKAQQEKRRLQERMRLKMVLPGDTKDIQADQEIFSLDNIKSKRHLDDVDEAGDDVALREVEDSDEESGENSSEVDSDDSDEEEGLEENEEIGGIEEEEEEDETDEKSKQTKNNGFDKKEKNPLLVELEPEASLQAKTNLWFQKDAFKGLEAEEDEDLEINQMVEEHRKKGGTVIEEGLGCGSSKNAPNGHGRSLSEKRKESKGADSGRQKDGDDADTESDSDSDSESDSDYEMEAEIKQGGNTKKQAKADGFEVVPVESSRVKKMTPEGLALGAQMAFSRKRKRDLEDDAYHRWSFNDANLPSWFVDEESKFYRRQLPVTKEQVSEYKARLREINARPVKKIAEAKARKKHKELKRLERARKKAEAISESVDVTEKEKMRQIKSLYKKASAPNKKKEIEYVVSKKSLAAKRMKRPAGVKGPYKRVDPRMKKDLRAAKAKEKTKGRAKGKKRR